MNTKQEILDAFSKRYGVDISKHATGRVTVKTIDYSNNPLAPEKTAYKIYFTLWGNKNRFSFYPNTVGYQAF